MSGIHGQPVPLPVSKGGTGDTGSAFSTAHTPVLTSSGGSVTGETITKAFRYKTIGKTTLWTLSLTLTNIGSGSPTGNIIATLPSSPIAQAAASGFYANGGSAVAAYAATDGKIYIASYSGTTLWANGNVLYISGFYEST